MRNLQISKLKKKKHVEGCIYGVVFLSLPELLIRDTTIYHGGEVGLDKIGHIGESRCHAASLRPAVTNASFQAPWEQTA